MSSDDLIITNSREISWMKKYLPDHHKKLVRAITEGKAIVTQEAPGCKAF